MDNLLNATVRTPRAIALCAVGALAATLCASTAEASPWTLPRGTVVFSTGFSYQTARREFFEQGGSRNYPLNGQYMGTTYSFGVRAGVGERLELELGIPLRTIGYSSDPVILLPRPAGYMGDEATYYRQSILNLSRNASGFGDLTLAARYRLLLNPIAVAVEVRVKAPTGYQGPSGTFGDQPQTNAQFLADPSRYARPENIRDDVTLGDGQLDVAPSVLLGTSFRTHTFLRLDAGYNIRFGGAGHQAMGTFSVGQGVGPLVLFYAWVRGVVTVTEGRVLGVSVAATNPDLPASQYAGLNNLMLRELRFERDSLDIGGGVIFRLSSDTEFNVGYSRTLWGRNTALVDALSLTLAVRTMPSIFR